MFDYLLLITLCMFDGTEEDTIAYANMDERQCNEALAETRKGLEEMLPELRCREERVSSFKLQCVRMTDNAEE